jgi:hypothetical protein
VEQCDYNTISSKQVLLEILSRQRLHQHFDSTHISDDQQEVPTAQFGSEQMLAAATTPIEEALTV